jgi:hypothetical protein
MLKLTLIRTEFCLDFSYGLMIVYSDVSTVNVPKHGLMLGHLLSSHCSEATETVCKLY